CITAIELYLRRTLVRSYPYAAIINLIQLNASIIIFLKIYCNIFKTSYVYYKNTCAMFGVTILGNNSALPAYNRHPTAQVITLNDQLFLLDCGEGTQMQMNLYKIRRSRINHIFISHLHGDHYFGLPGLITSYGLLSRKHDLHLYAP